MPYLSRASFPSPSLYLTSMGELQLVLVVVVVVAVVVVVVVVVCRRWGCGAEGGPRPQRQQQL
jgi:hypothetical protein